MGAVDLVAVEPLKVPPVMLRWPPLRLVCVLVSLCNAVSNKEPSPLLAAVKVPPVTVIRPLSAFSSI